MIGRNEVGGGGRQMFFEHLRRVLPQGAEMLRDDWRDRPSVRIEDIDLDGKEEMLISYSLQDDIYTTVFKHDYSFWYVSSTFKGTSPLRVKGIDLFPASLKEIGGQKWGFINHKGKFVTPVKYEDAKDFQPNGLAAVKTKGEYGLINQYGQFIVHPQYSYINPFSDSRAVVMDDKGFKVINERGKVLTGKDYSYISNYQNERALFAGTAEDGRYLYGFLNKQGKEVIPLKYESATDFNEDKAVVRVAEGQYELIDRKGRTLHSFSKAYVGAVSDGLMAFQLEAVGKFGFMNENGEVVIEPSFAGTQPFKDGRAIVNTDETFFRYGLIDQSGRFIIEPDYNNILFLGEGRVALGKAIDETIPFAGSKYAIADLNGKILTEFKYMNVMEYTNGLASASDTRNTFFIDKNGQVAQNLPIAKGNGTLSMEGALIKGNIDRRLRYYNSKGTLVWSQNQIIALNNRFRVIERKYNPNKDYLVYYPEIQGMRFEAMQKKVNQKLAQLSGVKEIDPNKQLEASYTGDFDVYFFKNRLLELEINGYDFPFGAAHGMPVKVFAKVDLESGVFYDLKDLFNPNSSYVEVLSGIIGEQIKNDPQYSYVFPDSYKGISPDQPFYIDANNLYIYFTPYEIAPYAAGFPTFTIPFSEIDQMINKSGAFWRAFH
jgi:hypothetical protein